MARPTQVQISASALIHNVGQVKKCAPNKKVIAMVKANAYGCGISAVVPVLEGQVDAFGVACIEEALAIKALGSRTPCILFQGLFSPEELITIAQEEFQLIIHQSKQLEWLLAKPLKKPVKIWLKVNTGMHRLGFQPSEVPTIIQQLKSCSWVKLVGILSHFACADEPQHPANQQQLAIFKQLDLENLPLLKSFSNSAAILALPQSHADAVRPGIMLYGISPFARTCGRDLGLRPVMRFTSVLTAIHHYPPGTAIGYGGIWQACQPSTIGVVAVGYGDGYPRHIAPNTPVWINGCEAPIVGRVSMDMLTVDLTNCGNVKLGDLVELWGEHIAVEAVATSAKTIAYELLCQICPRVRCDKIITMANL